MTVAPETLMPPLVKWSKSYSVVVTRLATGETVTAAMPYEWTPEGSIYWWTEGNFSCDCNRVSVFSGAGGNTVGDDEYCTHDNSRYRVSHAVQPDGTLIPIDDFMDSLSGAPPAYVTRPDGTTHRVHSLHQL